MEKVFLINILYKRLKEVGLPTGKMWLLREERKGHLNLRRDPSGRRRVTLQDMDEIVRAYYPGGTGSWSWE